MDATDDFLALMIDLSFLEEREEMTRANYGHSLQKRWEARVSICNTKIPIMCMSTLQYFLTTSPFLTFIENREKLDWSTNPTWHPW